VPEICAFVPRLDPRSPDAGHRNRAEPADVVEALSELK